MDFTSGLDDAGKAGYSQGSLIKQSQFEMDVPHRFRILMPIMPKHRVLYPCVVPDDKNPGQVRQSWRELRAPMDYAELDFKAGPTAIDALRDVDLAIRRAHKTVGTNDDIKSFFETQRQWVIPVLDRRDTTPEVKFLEVSWQIYNGLRKLEQEADEDDATRLSHGPIWVHDVIIKKQKKEKGQTNLKDNFNIEYTVKSAKNNSWLGAFPASLPKNKKGQAELFAISSKIEDLQATADALNHESKINKPIFTEAEFAIINMFSWQAEMLPQFGPMAPEKIVEQLVTAPIALNSANKQGLAYFPAPGELLEALVSIEMKSSGMFLPETTGADGQGAIPPESNSPAKLSSANEVKSPAKKAIEQAETGQDGDSKATGGDSTAEVEKVAEKPSAGVPAFVAALGDD